MKPLHPLCATLCALGVEASAAPDFTVRMGAFPADETPAFTHGAVVEVSVSNAGARAVSGASLLLADGRLMGSGELLADMVQDAVGCDTRAIVLTGEKYPSSYGDTVAVAQRELRRDSRPAIEPVNVSEYDEIILIYPCGGAPSPCRWRPSWRVEISRERPST